MTCELCDEPGGDVWWTDDLMRVVHVADNDHPGTCRVIANRHVKECTDLTPIERASIMNAVFAVETAMRAVLSPDKVNLASLGNLTPHVHWHVIPRFEDDPHFPSPVWTGPLRPRSAGALDPETLARLKSEIVAALAS